MTIDFPLLAFSIFSTIAILGSLSVILKKNPVSSAFSLVLVFFAFAGLYALIGAHLVAALQILVYAGAIMVLFVFVIMLLNQDEPVGDFQASGGLFKAAVILGLGALGAVLIRAVLTARGLVPSGALTDEKIASLGGNLQALSQQLFNDRVFHFELTSFLLLGAIVATVALAKRSSGGKDRSHDSI
jgi:NADH-quinone oxidoreductase subunit J